MEFLHDKARVALTGGSLFRGDGSAFVRINFATDAGVITEMMARIGAALKTL
jgi:bifunctional pyridoxal-dependent enzyme with beta-cystathionase and maltose regulon repressor activities